MDATWRSPRATSRNRSDRCLVKNRRRLHRRTLNSGGVARRILYVRVLQPALHYELEQISKPEILRKLKQRFGSKTIRDVRFRSVNPTVAILRTSRHDIRIPNWMDVFINCFALQSSARFVNRSDDQGVGRRGRDSRPNETMPKLRKLALAVALCLIVPLG